MFQALAHVVGEGRPPEPLVGQCAADARGTGQQTGGALLTGHDPDAFESIGGAVEVTAQEPGRGQVRSSPTHDACGAEGLGLACHEVGRGRRHGPLKYGRGYADAFPNGHFAPIPDAAHFPQIEQLGATLGAIGDFVNTVVKPGESD
ncbi:alpha/beta fold hydrolase [Streptomyces prunicolor]